MSLPPLPLAAPPVQSGLEVADLWLYAQGAARLAGIRFTAPPSAVTGVIGPNGAGKSTLLTTLANPEPSAQSPAARLRFDGTDLSSLRPRARSRLMAFVEQSVSADTTLTAQDVVALGRIPHQSLWQHDASAADQQAIDLALALTGLTHRAAQSYNSLSGGERQRVQIARALAQTPKLLILDEPTSHLDIRAQMLLMQLLQAQARGGVTVLLALHDLNLAARFCDHLVVLCEGRIVTQGPPQQTLTAELLRQVYGVQAQIVGQDPPQVTLLAPCL